MHQAAIVFRFIDTFNEATDVRNRPLTLRFKSDSFLKPETI